MVLNMMFIGKKEALKFIAEWESKLNLPQHREWQNFKQKRNMIAKKMGLNEKEMILISVVYLSGYISQGLRETNYLMHEMNGTKAGSDVEVMMIIGKITDVHIKYLEKCAYFKPQFDMEMERLNNHRR